MAALFAERERDRYAMHESHLNEQMVRVLKTIGFDVGFTRGAGQYLYDRNGVRYLDLLSGFGVFALMPDNAPLVIAINVIHGVCYAFFFATVYIFVDEHFPKDVRSSAQGLFNLMILGIGALIANFACPAMFDAMTKENVTDFKTLFLVPCGIAIVAAVALAIFFWPPKNSGAKVA